MPSRAFDRNARAGGRGNLRHDAQRHPLALEQRSLLDVQFHKPLVISARQFYRVKFPTEPCRAAHFVKRLVVAVLQPPRLLRRERPGKQPAAEASDSKSRWLFRREHKQLDRILRAKSAALQGPYSFKTSKNSHDAVVLPRVGNRVDVRAGADHRLLRM